MSRLALVFPTISLCLLSTGCLNNRYVAPVTTFHNSTTQTITTISAFYSSRNSFETAIYLSDLANDPTQPVQTIDAQGRPTPLGTPVFSPASIKARLDALQLVGVYATRLNDLANSSAPADFATQATALGTSLTGLTKTFQDLGANDATASSYVGPIASLVGTIGKMYLQGKRDQLVKEAVHEGGPKVNEILSMIKDDLDKIFTIEVITAANQELAQKIVAYNTDRSTLSLDQRVARLAEIQVAAQTASSATTSAPSLLVASMLSANNALLASANAPKKDKQITLASLNDALSAWTGQIQSLATQIKSLSK